MKAASILLNLCLSLFTLFVLFTDGMPAEGLFVALSLLLLLVPALTALVVNGAGSMHTRRDVLLTSVTAGCNVVLLGSSCWAFVTQFPSHPEEAGLVPFVVLTLAAPALSLFVLRRHLQPRSGARAA